MSLLPLDEAPIVFRLSSKAVVAVLAALVSLLLTAGGGAAMVMNRLGELETSDAKTERLINERIRLNQDRYESMARTSVRLETKVDELERRNVRIEDKLDRLLTRR